MRWLLGFQGWGRGGRPVGVPQTQLGADPQRRHRGLLGRPHPRRPLRVYRAIFHGLPPCPHGVADQLLGCPAVPLFPIFFWGRRGGGGGC